MENNAIVLGHHVQGDARNDNQIDEDAGDKAGVCVKEILFIRALDRWIDTQSGNWSVEWTFLLQRGEAVDRL